MSKEKRLADAKAKLLEKFQAEGVQKEVTIDDVISEAFSLGYEAGKNDSYVELTTKRSTDGAEQQ